jgi:low temperature requirement protein LtrA
VSADARGPAGEPAGDTTDATIGRRLLGALTGGEAVRAPTLRTGVERTASRLELFFDLAFVLVVAKLAGALRADVSVHGLLVFAGLFTVVWWSWAGTTLYANRFDHDDVLYRLYKLAGMAAVIGLAASATGATGALRQEFAACQLVLRAILLVQYYRAYRHVRDARPIVRLYLLGTGVGGLLWAVSLVVPPPICFVLWGVAVGGEVLVPLLATRDPAAVPLHLEHLPERFALFVILVLGESVTGIANGISAARWSAPALVAAALAFVLTAAVWWSYFDLAGARAKRLLHEAGGERSLRQHDVYVFGQLPLTLALAGIGAGVQLAVQQSGAGEVPLGTRVLVAGGVALYLAAASLTNSGMASRSRRGWWWPLGAAGIAALDSALQLPVVVVVGGLDLLLVLVVILGNAERSADRLPVDPL